jgi:hypothetical protein
MAEGKTIRVKFKKAIIYDHVNWSIGAVCDMVEPKAVYLIGTNFVEATTDPLTERPRMKVVNPKDTATATGNALAEALKSFIPQAVSPPPVANRQVAPQIEPVKKT